jgi:hypothetical protein
VPAGHNDDDNNSSSNNSNTIAPLHETQCCCMSTHLSANVPVIANAVLNRGFCRML